MQGRYRLTELTDAECEVKPWSKVPVLLVPDRLRFSSQPNSHKQILSIYNPSECPITFKVLATFPDAYTVNPVSGIILAQSQQDVIVRVKLLADGSQRLTDEEDKFLVETTDSVNSRRGQRAIRVFHSSPDDFEPCEDDPDSGPTPAVGLTRAVLPSSRRTTAMLRPARGNQPVAVLLRLLPLLLGTLAIIYFTRIQDPTSSRLLWGAFLVGLLTMHAQLKFLEN